MATNPLRVVACPECGADVGYGRLSCSECGAILASLAGGTRRPSLTVVADEPVDEAESPPAVVEATNETDDAVVAPVDDEPDQPIDADVATDTALPDGDPGLPDPDLDDEPLPNDEDWGAVSRARLADLFADARATTTAPAGDAPPPPAWPDWPASGTPLWPPTAPVEPPVAPAPVAEPPAAVPGAYRPPQPMPSPAAPLQPTAGWTRTPPAPGTPAKPLDLSAPGHRRDAVSFGSPVSLAGWLAAIGAGLGAAAFLLPWSANGVIGGQIGRGYLGQWGLANPAHLILVLLAVSILALQLVENPLPAWLRGGILPILLGGLFGGVVWTYIAGPFGAGPGVFVTLISAATMIVGGLLELQPWRHASDDRGV